MSVPTVQPVLAELPSWLVATWPIALGIVGSLVVLVALYALASAFLPKVAPIALTTAKAGLAHPLFWVELGFGAVVLILFFPFIPYFTLGEDIKMLKDSGLTLMLVLAVLFAVLSASATVADEIEGRTAVTLLSKPVRRWQFILGKFLGILAPVAVMFILLGAIFLATVSYKASDDAQESAATQPTAAQCQAEMEQVLPGIVLAFLETVVLAAISVAISTRLPMLANLLICATIYLLGHLMPAVVNSNAAQYPLVRFMGKFLATLLPNLDDFNIQAGIAAGSSVPLDYLGWATLYCLLYTTAALVVALLLFEDRDLA